MDNFEVTQPF